MIIFLIFTFFLIEIFALGKLASHLCVHPAPWGSWGWRPWCCTLCKCYPDHRWPPGYQRGRRRRSSPRRTSVAQQPAAGQNIHRAYCLDLTVFPGRNKYLPVFASWFDSWKETITTSPVKSRLILLLQDLKLLQVEFITRPNAVRTENVDWKNYTDLIGEKNYKEKW